MTPPIVKDSTVKESIIKKNPKEYYKEFLSHLEGKLHFAAHSHHFWPDVSRSAHMTYWDDSARLRDDKWEHYFVNTIPRAQEHIRKILNLKNKEQIVFAPNTHELLTRILSLFLGKSSLKVLTTQSEFHSFRRQIQRLMEIPSVEVEMVSTEELLLKGEIHRREFIESLKRRLKDSSFDLFFMSQVFFDSAHALTEEELFELTEVSPSSTLIVIDGYHGFGAIPTDLSRLQGRVFYLGGGYKYAQAGEGAGFMVVPKGEWRPAYTGWFSEFSELSCPVGKKVGYPTDGFSFFGATQDFSGLYRFNAVWDFFQKENLSVSVIHSYVQTLQKEFIQLLPNSFLKTFSLTPLYSPELHHHGHFLTFIAPDELLAQKAERALRDAGILIDRRGSRLRFGFGLYQDEIDVQELVKRIDKGIL